MRVLNTVQLILSADQKKRGGEGDRQRGKMEPRKVKELYSNTAGDSAKWKPKGGDRG